MPKKGTMTKNNKRFKSEIESDEKQTQSNGTINPDKLANLIHYDSILSELNAFDNVSKPKINKSVINKLEKNVNSLVNNDNNENDDIKSKNSAKSVKKQKVKQIEYEDDVPDILKDMSRLNEYYKRND